MLNTTGSREATAVPACFHKRQLENIPTQFQQKTYEKQNGCVWLSVCLLMYLVNRDVTITIAKSYEKDQDRYKWLDLFPKNKRSDVTTVVMKRSSLVQQLRHIPGNEYDVCKVRLLKDCQSKTITDLILNEKKEGLFVVILQDTNGSRSHVVGINVDKQLIYDCMEEKSFVLNVSNLSIYCGSNIVFNLIALSRQLLI